MCRRNYFLVICLVLVMLAEAQDISSYFSNIRQCLLKNDSINCVKEETVVLLNETIYSDEPINLFGNINITRDKDYIPPEIMQESMPFESSQRSMVLTDAICSKIEEFFKSRLIQFRIDNSVEGLFKFYIKSLIPKLL